MYVHDRLLSEREREGGREREREGREGDREREGEREGGFMCDMSHSSQYDHGVSSCLVNMSYGRWLKYTTFTPDLPSLTEKQSYKISRVQGI